MPKYVKEISENFQDIANVYGGLNGQAVRNLFLANYLETLISNFLGIEENNNFLQLCFIKKV